MGYNLKYAIPWESRSNSGNVYIERFNSLDASESLVLADDGIIINTTFSDWNEPIIRQNAEITIINNKSNFFELQPLMAAEEREFRIKICQTNPTEKILFEGYINSDNVEQTYLKCEPIRLVASNYFSKLEYEHPKIINTIQPNTLIDLISETIRLTGSDASIRANIGIYPSVGIHNENNSALNLSGLNTECFWQNNIPKDTGLDVIKKILKSFDSYIYWYDGRWYIERYEDLIDYPKHYVEYRTDVSYGYNSLATSLSFNDVSLNIFGFPHLDLNTTQKIIPGYGKIRINLKSDNVANFINNDLSKANPTVNVPELMFPTLKGVEYYQDKTYNFPGYTTSLSLFDISCGYKYYKTYGSITNSLYRYGWPFIGTNNYYNKCAITSRFKITIDPDEPEQTLNINFKYKPVIVGSHPLNTYDYQLRWFIHIAPSNQYVVYDPSSKHWYAKFTSDPAVYYQTTDLPGSSLDKSDVGIVDIRININDASLNYSGDKEFIFGLGIEKCKLTSEQNYVSYPLSSVYGDFNINTSGLSEQDNTIDTSINSKYLNLKEITLPLYDAKNLNYSNGFISMFNLERTGLWNDENNTSLSLVDRLIINKFQLYNRSRQSISSKIKCSEYLKPLSYWYDPHQPDKKFILVSYTYVPTKDEYECVWNEYDNSEPINIIEQ